jgi:aminoglycoside 6'-N-acetyltransferase
MTELRGEAVVLRPLAPEDAAALREMRKAPEVEEWWAPVEDDFPFRDDRESTRFTIFHEGRPAGLIQYGEETEPTYRHAWIDVFVDARLHGRGICTDAIRTLLRHLTEDRGHHRVTIDPTVGNEAARRCYEKAGFEHVGRMRRAERDWRTGEWRDALFMEYVVPD